MPRFKSNLKNIRERKGFTQIRLAKAVGCTQGRISELEQGKSLPGFRLSLRFEKVLRVPVSRIWPQDGQVAV